MKPAVELNELMNRIRQGAERENGLRVSAMTAASAPTNLPPVPEAVSPPPTPAISSASAGDAARRPEGLLDQAADWLRSGRRKNTVSTGVPRLLRPLFRNQGGYNSVLLEAVERLVEVNRSLRQQNFELQERLMYFDAWAHSVAQTSAESRDWTLAAAARLQALAPEDPGFDQSGAEAPSIRDEPASFVASGPSDAHRQIEDRLSQLTARAEANETERRVLNEHVNRLRAQLGEQAEYIRTVHRHLDQLGTHVDASLSRASQSA